MAGQPLPLAPDDSSAAACEASPPPAIPELAAAEAIRLEIHRRLARRSAKQPAGSRTSGAATSIRTRRIAPGLYFVFSVAIRRGDGAIVHAEPRLIRVELHAVVDRAIALSRAYLLDMICALGGEPDGLLAEIARQHDATRLKEITSLALARGERVRQRQNVVAAEVSGGRPLASQLLVQPGLFDRRWWRAAARHQSALVTLEDRNEDVADVRQAFRTAATTVELLAALHVTAGA
jgi:hypothetical protein